MTELLRNHRIMLPHTKSVLICVTDKHNKIKAALGDWHEPNETPPQRVGSVQNSRILQLKPAPTISVRYAVEKSVA